MYHRFNESKYPSTNIQMDVFKEHINLIRDSKFDFFNPKNIKKEFNISKKQVDFISLSGQTVLHVPKKKF